MNANPVEEHGVGDDDGYYGYISSVKVSTIKDMEIKSSALNDFGVLFL
jgi:hypothetical protein